MRINPNKFQEPKKGIAAAFFVYNYENNVKNVSLLYMMALLLSKLGWRLLESLSRSVGPDQYVTCTERVVQRGNAGHLFDG